MRTIVVFEAVWRAMVDAAPALAAAPDCCHGTKPLYDCQCAADDAVLDSYADENQRLSDRIRELEAAAAAAVGGAQTEAKQLWDWLQGYLEEECSLDPGCVSESDRSNLINGILNTIAAPPASPLRGREPEDLAQQLIDATKRSGVDMYTATLLWRASSLIDRLSASPPEQPAAGCICDEYNDKPCPIHDEQPAADPEIFRCNCPHEVRYGCSEPRCPHYTPPAAVRKFTGPGHLEQTGYTDPDKDQDSSALMPPRTET